MCGLETTLKSTRPRPGHYETETETTSKRPRPRKIKEICELEVSMSM